MPVHVVPPVRKESLHLPDGRRLAWSEWGPADGTPVLFCTGAGMSGSLGFGTAELNRLNVRLLAVDRPGLGASTAHPGKTLTSWSDDIGELISARLLTKPRVVGFSQGAPFALALAATRNATAVALVSGQDDFGHPRTLEQLPSEVSKMVMDARTDSAAFEDEIAATASADWIWRMILSLNADCDRRIYEEEVFAERYRVCLKEGFSQGSRGYARDLAITFDEWPFTLARLSVPVDLWYGRQDTSPVHSPDFGETLASRIPGASLTVDERAGGAILWTRAADILGKLIAPRPVPAKKSRKKR